MNRRRLATTAAGVVVIALMSGCTAGSKDSATASMLCMELREFDNRIVDQVNASVQGITAVPGGQRMDRFLDGLDAVDAEFQAWDRRIDSIPLPDIDERLELRRQLHSGVDAALAELDDQRNEFELVTGPVADDDVQGVVEAWFNAVEKVFSVSEPEVFRFERTEFKQAFLDEPDCRNVIQQFVND